MGRPRRRLGFKYPVFLGREPLRISKRLSKGDAYKPGFVPVDTGDDHLSVRAIAGGIERPTRTPTGQAARALSCGVLLGLAPDGACRADSVARTAVSSCLAISPLPALPAGGIFLLRYPSHFCAWTLSSILPCGARTFLPRVREGGHPASLQKS